MSETYLQFGVMASRNYLGQHDTPQLRKVFASLALETLKAIDDGNIQFKNTDDRNMVMTLIMLSMDYGLDGGLKAAVDVCYEGL